MPDSFPYEIKEYTASGSRSVSIEAIREVPLTIFLNEREVVTLLCTGKYPRHLAVGFLKSDALLSDPAQLLEVDIADEGARITARVRVSHDPWEGGRTIQQIGRASCRERV